MEKLMSQTFRLMLIEMKQQLQYTLQLIVLSILKASHSQLNGDAVIKTLPLLLKVLSYKIFILCMSNISNANAFNK